MLARDIGIQWLRRRGRLQPTQVFDAGFILVMVDAELRRLRT